MFKLLGGLKTVLDSRRHRISSGGWYGGLLSSQGEKVAGEKVAGEKADDAVKLVPSGDGIKQPLTMNLQISAWWGCKYESCTYPVNDARCLVPTQRGLGRVCMKGGLWFLGEGYSTGVRKNISLDNESESESVEFSPTRVRVTIDGSLHWDPAYVGGEGYWIRNEDNGSFIHAAHNNNDEGKAKLTAALCEFRAGENGMKAAVALECDEIILATDCEAYYLAFKECLTKGEYPPVPVRGKHTALTYNHLLQQQAILIRTLDSIPTGTKIKLVKLSRDDNLLANALAILGRVCTGVSNCYYSFDEVENHYKFTECLQEAVEIKTGKKKMHHITDKDWKKIRTSISQPFPTSQETAFISWNRRM